MSGIFLNPKGNNAFTELVNNRITKTYVDKTAFIGETINRLDSDGKLIAFTRPRRFGKTVMARMLASYYSKGDDCKTVFAKQKIAKFKGEKLIENKKRKVNYKMYLNRYDLIYVDMNTVDTKYLAYLKGPKADNVTDVADFLEYLIISEFKEHSEFAPILEKENTGNLGLADVLTAIHKSLGLTFVLIMDEWDLIYREYRNDEKLQKKFIDLLKGLFKSSDCLECFSLAYLTGILPIKKYNSQSALNNFDEINMLTPGTFAPYFGFTREEVDYICEQSDSPVSRSDLRDWYDGYRLKMPVQDSVTKEWLLTEVDIYNPNSVSKAVNRNECANYWSGTSSNEEVIRLINLNYEGIKTDILSLIEGAQVSFNSSKFQNDMVSINSRDDVLSLLVCLGYLGCRDGSVAYVPNREIRDALIGIVSGEDWFPRMETIERSEALLKAITVDLDGSKAAELIQDIHNSPAVSMLDYNSEESLTYCVMTGLLWSTAGKYDSHREGQAGKGRTDLVYEPRIRSSPLILIEFKYNGSAESAVSQIKKQEYFKRYAEKYTNIILVGINYSKLTKEHQCTIEKLEK